MCLVAQSCLTFCDPMDRDSPGKNNGAGCHALPQGIFSTQGSNPGLQHCRPILYHLSHQGSPRILEWVAYPFSRGSSWPSNQTSVSCLAGWFFSSWATREAEYLIQNARLDEAQAGIRISRGHVNDLIYEDDTTLVAESKEELKKLLMNVKQESEKGGLKLNIQKTKIMASTPKTPLQIDGKTMETVIDFIFFGSKMTVEGDCSYEIKTHLHLGRKAMTNSILKSRDIIFPTKVHIVKTMVSPVIMYMDVRAGP